ncbi:hypothetical protein [Paenibacillus ehimensis]|uniref:Uncharacterized protein n=1 Tax=Paenibacillus ehimensis TaxID=79264 RepID=A0ABT8V944_9BACL|nr:hypothetical protein [Paenibacillus ehimensis]MDO3677583.1 hypothetical protein [Paenibacillus ehimensis]MEC0208861.1 hypothetical protein [Paenibacillus ehimensis]
MTTVQMEELQNSVEKIYTENGLFKKVGPGPSVDTSKAPNNLDSIDAETKVLVLEEGIGYPNIDKRN